MEQAAYDREFKILAAPLRYEFSVFEASYDPRLLRMADKYLDGDVSVNYVEVLDIAHQYRIHRDDVLGWAENLAMAHILEGFRYAAT